MEKGFKQEKRERESKQAASVHHMSRLLLRLSQQADSNLWQAPLTC